MAKTLSRLAETIDAAEKLMPPHTNIRVKVQRGGTNFEITQIVPTARDNGTGVDLTLFVQEIDSDDDDE